MYENCTQKHFFWGVCIGGAVGALTALLFTTKKGQQLQNRIGDLCEDAQDLVKDTFSKAKDEVEDITDHFSKKVTGHKIKEDHAK